MKQRPRFSARGQAMAVATLLPGIAAVSLLVPARSASVQGTDLFPKVKRIVDSHCVPCHNPKNKQGALDLARFRRLADLHADPTPWVHVLEQVEAGQMPPPGSKQLSPADKRVLLETVRKMLDDEARSRKDDPGVVPVRRLSNAEYDRTIRDLTGVDLRPTREVPPDGAGGEGFTNASESRRPPPAATGPMKGSRGCRRSTNDSPVGKAASIQPRCFGPV